MLRYLRKIWAALERRRRLQLIVLWFLMLLSALLEMASIGGVAPFLSLLLDPNSLRENKHISAVFEYFSLVEYRETVLFLTGAFLFIVILAASVRAILAWINIRLSNAIGLDFEFNMFRTAIYKDYEFHIQQNISEFSADIFKAAAVVTMMLAVLTILQAITGTIFILTAIFYIDAAVSLMVFSIVGGFYAVTSFTMKKALQRHALVIANYSRTYMKTVHESLGAIRDILLEGKQEPYARYFYTIGKKIKWAAGSNQLIGQAPRMLIEPVGIVTIASFAGYFALQGSFAEKLPVFGVIAIAAQRLMPMIQQIYQGFTSIRGAVPSVHNVFEVFDDPNKIKVASVEPLSFEEGLEFVNVAYRYPKTEQAVLENVSFRIKQGTTFGIIGITGSGKSTLLDLILGLLRPVEGHLCVDGAILDHSNYTAWQRTVAHVPQDVFIFDKSIAENIAFDEGNDPEVQEKVMRCIKHAQLTDLISGLPEGLNAVVGERGKQLSGGQRQRIGIARALYRNASVLVLDEATSALDQDTEQRIINELVTSYKKITIILVTHRMASLRFCDEILEVANGRAILKNKQDLGL